MTAAQIIRNCLTIAEARHGIPIAEMLSYDRRRHVVQARHEAMRMAHKLRVTIADIARAMHRDHRTVSHAIRKGEA